MDTGGDKITEVRIGELQSCSFQARPLHCNCTPYIPTEVPRERSAERAPCMHPWGGDRPIVLVQRPKFCT